MLIRPAASMLSIDEAMKQVKEVHTVKELKDTLNDHFGGIYYDIDTLQCRFYGKDSRTGWDTYLLTADLMDGTRVIQQQAIAFADSPMDKLPLCIVNGKPLYLNQHV